MGNLRCFNQRVNEFVQFMVELPDRLLALVYCFLLLLAIPCCRRIRQRYEIKTSLLGLNNIMDFYKPVVTCLHFRRGKSIKEGTKLC